MNDDYLREFETEFPHLAVGTLHGWPDCECGSVHSELFTDNRVTRLSSIVQTPEWICDIDQDVEARRFQAFDDWGRKAGPPRLRYEIVAHQEIRAERNPDYIPPTPPRPTDAVNTATWTDADPAEVSVVVWAAPTAYRIRVLDNDQGHRWLALYWRHSFPYADGFDTKEEAEAFLEAGSDNGDLSEIGVITRSDDPQPI